MFFGHTHLQGCWFSLGRDLTGVKLNFPSTSGTGRFEVVLRENHRYLVNPGSVGQPRDSDWRAAFAVYDDAEATLTLFRVPYDVTTAQQRIRRAGLPDALAARLQQGR
jgi:diadenosine tetraphosphatase ApaH/serine/threonine PP2A family protein phosphatase